MKREVHALQGWEHVTKLDDNMVRVALIEFRGYFVQNKRAISTPRLAAASAVAIILATSAFLLLNTGGAISISSATTINITRSASAFRIGNYTYAVALASAAPSRNVAYVYIGRLPAFMNPLLNVTIYLAQSTKVNVGGAYANIDLQLDGIGSNAVTLTIDPIRTSLGILPDSAYISVAQSALPSLQPGPHARAANVSTTSVTVTTVQSTSTASTTVSSTNTTRAMVLDVLQKTVYYPLMLNYSSLYANTLSCTPALYNSTYFSQKGIQPTGPNTYANLSKEVPYALYMNISVAGTGTYAVVYSTRTRDPFFNSSAALTIGININSNTVSTVGFGGVFQGFNYTTLLNGYRRSANAGNACGAYIA